MDQVMQILTIMTLIPMMVSDYRCRSVSAYQMYLFLLSTICFAVASKGLKLCLMNIAGNFMIILVLFVFVTLYFKIRTGFYASILGSIGMGDVMFFIALLPLYSMMEYLCLIIVASLVSLLVWIIDGLVHRQTDTIPLITTAGIVYTIYSLLEFML